VTFGLTYERLLGDRLSVAHIVLVNIQSWFGNTIVYIRVTSNCAFQIWY